MAKRLGVPNTYQDYCELLGSSNVDAVIIALPTHLHAECARAALENHKHVLLEKPLARNTEEGKLILSAADNYGVKLMVGYPALFFPPNERLKAKIDSGELGEIQMVHAVNVGTGPFGHRADTGAPVPVPDWWWKKELIGGGALIDLGSHMINLTRWYFGNIVEAKSYLGYRFHLEAEDHAICLLKFERGQICVINVGWFSQSFESKIDVYGTVGSATTVQGPVSRARTALQLLLRKTPSSQIPFIREVQHFVGCLLRDEQPQPSGEEALRDLEVIELAYANRLKFG